MIKIASGMDLGALLGRVVHKGRGGAHRAVTGSRVLGL